MQSVPGGFLFARKEYSAHTFAHRGLCALLYEKVNSALGGLSTLCLIYAVLTY